MQRGVIQFLGLFFWKYDYNLSKLVERHHTNFGSIFFERMITYFPQQFVCRFIRIHHIYTYHKYERVWLAKRYYYYVVSLLILISLLHALIIYKINKSLRYWYKWNIYNLNKIWVWWDNMSGSIFLDKISPIYVIKSYWTTLYRYGP